MGTPTQSRQFHRYSCPRVLVSLPVSSESGGQADTVVFHDLATLPWTELREGFRIKPIIGQSGTFAIVEFTPKVGTSPHHHTHEQINFGLGGSLEIEIGGIRHHLQAFDGTIAPPDAEHLIVNDDIAKGTFVEFQPLRRLDLLPAYPSLVFPTAGEPAAVSGGHRITSDFDTSSNGWQVQAQNVRVKMLTGQTCRLAVWVLPGAIKTSVSLAPRTRWREQFVYLLEGHVEFTVGSSSRNAGPGTLLLVGGTAGETRVRSVDEGRVVLVVFESGEG